MLPLAKGKLVLVLWLFPFLAGAAEVFPLDHVWRYEQLGADLGTAWRETVYDDSAWPQGRGVLAAEDNAVVRPLTNTVLTRIGTNGQYKVIDYFRTRFHLPEVRLGHFLRALVLVDDGAVVYLNGAELFRVRMPAGPVNASTLASETIDVGREGIFVNTNIVPANLLAGDNVLAVEVHQPYITSSDVTWGMILTYAPMEPLVITRQPEDRTVAEGKPIAFAVIVSGTLPRFQWWKDAEAIAGQTNATLSLPSAFRADAGQYFVTTANDVSAVTSRVATLTVALDRIPPRLEFASRSSGAIYAAFSDILDPDSSINLESYRIVNANGAEVPITLVSYGLSAVWITAGELMPGINHYLFVSDVRDQFGNAIVPDSGVSIATMLTNLPIESIWKYNDAGVAPDAEWHQPGYDDSQWNSGAALLYNDANLSLQPPGALKTRIAVTNDSGPIVTHYFRLRFTNQFSPFGASFNLSHYVDDGAVFYLNGSELARFNMPSGPTSPATRASRSGTEGSFNGGVDVSSTNLAIGPNVLAAEVHQFSLASPDFPDISFGIQGRAHVESFLNVPVRILQEPQDLTVQEGAPAMFVATVAAAESVQWYRDDAPIPGATDLRYPLSVTVDAQFALVASNSFGMVTSRTARLTVIPDLTPPRVLGAQMGTNVDRVVLAFSEGLVATPQNFAITNESGQNLEILSVDLVDGTNVVLTTAPRTAGRRYLVIVNGVADVSYAGNTILSNSVVGIDYEELLVAYDSVWKYDENGTNFFEGWHLPLFDDAHWPSGPGLLGFEDSPLLPLPIQTVLTPPEFRGPTYYFRRVFNFSGDPAGAILRLRYLADDGVVLFLNGQEVHRARVPAGQNIMTLAEFQVPDGTIEGPHEISSGALVGGLNVLAAEVHQVSPGSADVVFGAELARAFPANPPGPSAPTLEFAWREGELILSWDAWDFVLECATELSDPWQPAPRPTIPYAVPGDLPAKFFRLKKKF